MKINMKIDGKNDFDVVKIVKIKSIVQFEYTWVAEKYISVNNYYPIIKFNNGNYRMLYGDTLMHVVNGFSTDETLEYVLNVLSKYAEYDIIDVESYDRDNDIIITKEGYEVELI